jgi:ATP-dependent 26S proteasome regulatory subunit
MPWVKIGWIVLVLTGLVAIIAGFVYTTPAGIIAIVASVGVWIAYATTVDYILGLQRRFVAHLGPKYAEGELLAHKVEPHSRADVQLALDSLRATIPDAKRYGVMPDYGLPEFEHPSGSFVEFIGRNPRPTTIRYTRAPRSKSETLKVAENVVLLLRLPGGEPYAVMWIPGQLEVLAATPELSQQALDLILSEAKRLSVYRGVVISLRRTDEEDLTQFEVEFHDLPDVARDDIVLPEAVTQVVDRNVLGWLARADALRRAGQATRHGVLLHGPPGTGKSLVVKYLAGAARGVTVVLLTGRQLALVRESCRLARLLAPSIIVLEDVDLIATDREKSQDTTLLHDLMDEMDGLGPRTDVIFLLTTNRPEVVERALTARPGRVDQAIYFPLPDRDCRRRLFAVFGRELDLSGVDIEALLDRTDGASPAFLAELFRKAVVLADERGESSEPMKLTDADFLAAVRELVEFGGELTRNLLGYRANP